MLIKKIKEIIVKVGQHVKYIKSQKFSYLGSLPLVVPITKSMIILFKKQVQYLIKENPLANYFLHFMPEDAGCFKEDDDTFNFIYLYVSQIKICIYKYIIIIIIIKKQNYKSFQIIKN